MRFIYPNMNVAFILTERNATTYSYTCVRVYLHKITFVRFRIPSYRCDTIIIDGNFPRYRISYADRINSTRIIIFVHFVPNFGLVFDCYTVRTGYATDENYYTRMLTEKKKIRIDLTRWSSFENIFVGRWLDRRKYRQHEWNIIVNKIIKTCWKLAQHDFEQTRSTKAIIFSYNELTRHRN